MSLITDLIEEFEEKNIPADIEASGMDISDIFEEVGESTRTTICEVLEHAHNMGLFEVDTYKDARDIVVNWEAKSDTERLAVVSLYDALNSAARDLDTMAE